jgi:tRNA pseudouridine38-40 synthase
MRNFKLTVEYDGTDFHGFQRQRGLRTVQGELEAQFSRLLRETVKIIAAGRTDAGVHAIGQTANFHSARPIEASRLVDVLNAALPGDVQVQECEEVAGDFHARRSARSRTYRYTIIERRRPSPLLGRYALLVPGPLRVNRMSEAARPLWGRHDFRAFRAAGSESKTTHRTIERLSCRRMRERVEITVEADSFLYKMVRKLVSGLLKVGCGELPPSALAEAMDAGQSLPRCPPASARGLCLVRVSY